jgi:hypothetical protein
MSQAEGLNSSVLSFLWENKCWWLLPMILMIVGLGVLSVFGP